MAKEEQPKKKKEQFVAQLQIVDADKPPIKTIIDQDSEEVYTIEAAIAKIMNDISDLKEGLL